MILIYHSVLPDASSRGSLKQALPLSAFIGQVSWLTRHRQIVPLTEYLEKSLQHTQSKRLVSITFDDGFKATFDCVFPFLIEKQIPTTWFITTGHLEDGELLWFSYLHALCYESSYKEILVNDIPIPMQTLSQRKRTCKTLHTLARNYGNPSLYFQTLSLKYPLPQGMVEAYRGMTNSQVRLATDSRIVEVGAHTHTHPFLDKLTKGEQAAEISNSKNFLQMLTGQEVSYFAYPSGEYNVETVNIVKKAGYQASFAIIPKKLGLDAQYEMPRIGIYSRSINKLQLKAWGLADWGRRFHLQVG